MSTTTSHGRRGAGSETAAGSLDMLGETVDAPEPPAEGLTQFVAVTGDGLRAAVAPEEDLGEDRHELASVFHSGHEVITQIRLESD